MNTKENIQLSIIATVGVIVLGVASTMFVLGFNRLHSIENKTQVVMDEIEIFSNQNKNTQTLKRVIREIKEQQYTLTTYFIQESDIARFLGEIEKIQSATGAQIQIKAVAAGDAIDKDGVLTPLTITITSKGEFNQVIHTLSILESLPSVSKVDMAKLTQDAKSKVWTGNFRLKIIKRATVRGTDTQK